MSPGIFPVASDSSMCPGVDAASKNEYQDNPGGKGGRCLRPTTYHLHVPIVKKSGDLNLLEPCGPVQACNGTALPFYNIPILLLLLLLLLFFSLSDLSMNSIRHIPGELFQGTKKLAVLHLSGNSLKDLPEHIFQDLVHLEELDLSNNELTEIQTGVFRGM